MSFTMNASSLLSGFLLLLTACDQLLGSKEPEEMLQGSDRFWKLHMRDFLMKGKGPSPDPIREVVKQQLLYCRAGIGYHLQILPSGLVGGVHKPTQYCWLKVSAMKRGVVGIRGTKSGLYLCMNGKGQVYGTEQFSDECLFNEKLEENHYTTYSSYSHTGNYLALSHKGELRRGNSVNPNRSCTHFLPRRTLCQRSRRAAISTEKGGGGGQREEGSWRNMVLDRARMNVDDGRMKKSFVDINSAADANVTPSPPTCRGDAASVRCPSSDLGSTSAGFGG
ncbi:fibroblast growth factor 4B [Melanotaenia boesemani]|uniref:fibroblast growth factor 4B n=1 Tax=Melanotaenia boesemani TaxID=1250792 RepID=UPI001C050CFC|nr:fibroblast growth factor 4B [Melanotaenia boesemani]